MNWSVARGTNLVIAERRLGRDRLLGGGRLLIGGRLLVGGRQRLSERLKVRKLKRKLMLRDHLAILIAAILVNAGHLPSGADTLVRHLASHLAVVISVYVVSLQVLSAANLK